MIQFRSIGTITSPFERSEDMPIQSGGARGIPGTIVLDPEFQEGLKDLDGFSHILLVYYFDRSSGYSLVVKPFLDHKDHGVFATRAPRRPNQIGISVVRLLKIDGNILHIEGVDVLNGTPLLDIKPYIPQIDAVSTERNGWISGRESEFLTKKSDGRFSDSSGGQQ